MFWKVPPCRRTGFAALLLAVLWWSVPAARAQMTAAQVTVEQSAESGVPTKGSRTVYRLSDGANHAELIVDRLGDPRLKTELRFNVWQGERQSYRDNAALPIGRRLDFFRPLMERFFETEKPEASYGLLFYGYKELYDRLPGLAARDAGWNRRTGRPVKKTVGYGYLQELLNRGPAYQELADAVAALHYRVRIVGGMEELRVLPVSKLTEAQRQGLPEQVKQTDLLPARIAIDFTLTH